MKTAECEICPGLTVDALTGSCPPEAYDSLVSDTTSIVCLLDAHAHDVKQDDYIAEIYRDVAAYVPLQSTRCAIVTKVHWAPRITTEELLDVAGLPPDTPSMRIIGPHNSFPQARETWEFIYTDCVGSGDGLKNRTRSKGRRFPWARREGARRGKTGRGWWWFRLR